MAVVAGFVILIGIPLVVASALDGIRAPRLAKLVLFASFPAGLAAFFYLHPLGLDQIGVPAMALFAVVGWTVGFAGGPWNRCLWRFGARTPRRLRQPS